MITHVRLFLNVLGGETVKLTNVAGSLSFDMARQG